MPEESTRAGELEHGQVDAAETILPPDYTTVQSNPDLRLYVVPGAGADYQYLINTQQAPWNNTQLRIALRDSINLPALLKGVYQGEYTQAWGPIMPDTADYDPAVRCPRAEAICATAEPPLAELTEGHAVACHFPG